MKDSKVKRARQQAMMLGRQFLEDDVGVFERAVGAQVLAAAISTQQSGCRDRIYPALDTLRLFVGQMLSTDRACQDVVSRRLSERVAQGQSQSALGTSAYCEARQRLPVAMPQNLSVALSEQLEALAPMAWRWQGRTVKLFDGTTVSMPDTPSNQRAYPQSRTQKTGVGFPIARIGALIGLASGAILRHQVSACAGKGSGEQSILTNLLDHLQPGDVVLADALLATWWIVAGSTRRGADVVMAQHGRRITDFAAGQRLGKHDHIVHWPRPPKPPTMSAQEYASYPPSLTMREVKAKGRVLVTTLLDPQWASRPALSALYKMRWHIEVDFRTIKSTLQMDVLRCKSPSMVEKEIAVSFLAYNLVRWAMAKAAALAHVLPRTLSFTGAKRLLNAFAVELRRTANHKIHPLIETILVRIGSLKLRHRPDRIEPRAKKRRPKPLPLLTVPRQIARDLILAHRSLNRVA